MVPRVVRKRTVRAISSPGQVVMAPTVNQTTEAEVARLPVPTALERRQQAEWVPLLRTAVAMAGTAVFVMKEIARMASQA